MTAVQAALGALSATAPITAAYPDGPLRAVIFNGAFSLLWLGAAALFHTAGRRRSAARPGEAPIAE